MSENRIPTLQQAHELLCTGGEMFPEPRNLSALDELTFDHPTKGRVGITIDEEVLAAQGEVFVGDPALRQALQKRNIHTYDLRDANHLLREYLQSDELVWGFSGYATAGYSYATEAEGLIRLYDQLAKIGQEPGLAVDGGVSAGNLGLSAVTAAMYDVPTVGMIPRQGLADIGPRDHLVIWGNTYSDREILVGTTPDILTCIGGGDGTQRECQAALRYGSSILLLALKDEYAPNSLPNTYQAFEDMQAAVDAGTMVVCRTVDAIPDSIDQILETCDTERRPTRIDTLSQLLVS